MSELVVRGHVNCDSFAGLRALLVPASKRPAARSGRQRRVMQVGIEDAGRWSPIPQPVASPEGSTARPTAALEHLAQVLLRRYGVVCWRLLEREAAWLPPWRKLVRIYRRLEARGEIRGGRFIAGLTGEQFALPEAITRMRQLRHAPAGEGLVCLAAADPANLLGAIVPGPRLARVAGARVVYRGGVPIATSIAGRVDWLVDLSPAEQQPVLRVLTLDPAWRLAEPATELAA